MVFSSSVFIFVFLPITLVLYYIPVFKSLQAKNNILLLMSLIFYAWGEPIAVVIMLLSIVWNHRIAICINSNKEGRSKRWLQIGVVANVICLFVFKYADFFLSEFFSLFGYDVQIGIALPIGISFYTFQAISYLVDVYWGRGKALASVLDVGLYIAFFPQLVAGPIVRFETIAREIEERTVAAEDFYLGIRRFIVGLAKKCILANNLAYIVDCAYGNVGDLSVAMAWLGAMAYILQVYFDFGGYSDMAIGLGQMFGFHYTENFNYPYIASSITDFWNRWHISLSSWLRDYVFVPLSLNRNLKKKLGNNRKRQLVFALFITWFITGLWHGASWNYIFWGLFYLVFILLEKYTALGKIKAGIGNVYTLFVVVIADVFFRSTTMTEAFAYLGNMFNVKGNLIDEMFFRYIWAGKGYILLGILGCVPWKNIMKKYKVEIPAIISNVYLIILFGISLTYMIQNAYNPFIYFNF